VSEVSFGEEELIEEWFLQWQILSIKTEGSQKGYDA
jgi:hypothetical protein